MDKSQKNLVNREIVPYNKEIVKGDFTKDVNEML